MTSEHSPSGPTSPPSRAGQHWHLTLSLTSLRKWAVNLTNFLGEGQFRVRCQCCPALLGGLVGPLGLCSLVIYEGSEPCLGSGYPSGVRFTAHFLREVKIGVGCQCCPALLGGSEGPLGLGTLVIYEGPEPCLGSGYPSGVRFTAHFLEA